MFNSDNLPDKLKEIENYIESNIDAMEKHPECSNLPSLSKNLDFKTKLSEIDFHHFIQSADYHYFVARVLFLKHVYLYSFFSSQQCVECYLKAFLKYYEKPIITTHDLKQILASCQKLTVDQHHFINSKHIEGIIEKYNPFNELPRYPVYKSGPRKGQWGTIFPVDIWYLDYFVYKMREFLSIPTNTWDIFRNGHYNLYQTKNLEPEFYNLFLQDNINFNEK